MRRWVCASVVIAAAVRLVATFATLHPGGLEARNLWSVPAWQPYAVAVALFAGAVAIWTHHLLFQLLAAWWAALAGALASGSDTLSREPFMAAWVVLGVAATANLATHRRWWGLPAGFRASLAFAAAAAVIAAAVAVYSIVGTTGPMRGPVAVSHALLILACAECARRATQARRATTTRRRT